MSLLTKLAMALTDIAATEPLNGDDDWLHTWCYYCERDFGHAPDCPWAFIRNNLDSILGRLPSDPW